MKKLLCVLLVVACLTFVVGCSNSKTDEKNKATETVSKPADTDTDYVNDFCMVEYGDTVYCADDTGVWKTTDGGSNKEYISKITPARYIATNGKTVFLSTFDEEDSESIYEENCSIYCVNADGTDEHKVLDTVGIAQPICVNNNILYYSDIKDEEAKEYPAAMLCLKSYDLATGDQKVLTEDAATVTSIGSKIILRKTVMSIDAKDAILRSYDTQTGEIEEISDVSAADMEVIDDKLYFSNLTTLENNESKIAMYCYNPESGGKSEKLFEELCDISAMIQCFNSEYAYYYNADESNNYKYYRVDLKSKDTTEITGLPNDCDLAYFVGDDVYYKNTANGDSYYFNGDETFKVNLDFGEDYIVGYYQGTFFYSTEAGIETKEWSFSEGDVIEEQTIAETPSINSEDTVSYDEYLGFWEKKGMNNASISVEFKSFDGNNATFIVYKNSANYSQIAQTNEITAEITDGNIINFNFTDSFTNEGYGTITLNGDTIHLFADSEDLPNTGFGVFGDCDLEKR